MDVRDGDNKLMKILSLALALFAALPLTLSAETYVRFADHSSSDSSAQNDFVPAAAEATSFFDVIYSKPSGDGTSEEAPGTVFVPVDGDTSTETIQNQTHFRTNANNGLPGMDLAKTNHAYLRLRLDVKNDLGESAKLWVAAEDSSGTYRVFGKTGANLNYLAAVGDGADGTGYYTIELADLCNLSFMASVCTSFNSTSTSTSTSMLLYFFLDSATNDYDDDRDIDPATFNHGVYLKLNLSSKSLENTTITLAEVNKGDGRLKLSYAGANPADLDAVYAYFTTNVGTNPGDELLKNVDSSVTRKNLETIQTNYTVDLKDLENGVTYQIAVSFLNKYGFSTKTSNALTGTPLDIEEFLKSQACYLLSAGFGEEHYVIEYFKGFRDHFLKKYYLGRAFINFYYSTAPKYALYIYSHKWLAAVVRGAAYVMYFVFVFNGLPLILALISGALIRFIYIQNVKRRSDKPQ